MKYMNSSSREIATGTGLNLQLSTPLREEMPRLPAPNFFYAQATKAGLVDWHSASPLQLPRKEVYHVYLFQKSLYEKYCPSTWQEFLAQEMPEGGARKNGSRVTRRVDPALSGGEGDGCSRGHLLNDKKGGGSDFAGAPAAIFRNDLGLELQQAVNRGGQVIMVLTMSPDASVVGIIPANLRPDLDPFGRMPVGPDGDFFAGGLEAGA